MHALSYTSINYLYSHFTKVARITLFVSNSYLFTSLFSRSRQNIRLTQLNTDSIGLNSDEYPTLYTGTISKSLYTGCINLDLWTLSWSMNNAIGCSSFLTLNYLKYFSKVLLVIAIRYIFICSIPLSSDIAAITDLYPV